MTVNCFLHTYCGAMANIAIIVCTLFLFALQNIRAEIDWWDYITDLAPVKKNNYSREDVLHSDPFKNYKRENLENANKIALKNGFNDFEKYFSDNPTKSFSDYAKTKGFDDFADTYERYQVRFKRRYVEPESPVRQIQLLASLKSINATNARNESFKFGLTSMTDRTYEEYDRRMGAAIPIEELDNNGYNSSEIPRVYRNKRSSEPLPTDFDWRENGVVYPIEDQGDCMSCWAFSTTSVIESHYAIKYGKQKLRRLSVQQLLDCAHDKGCAVGFWPSDAMGYIVDKKAGLVSSGDSYPYSNPPQAASCHTTQDNPMKISGFVKLPKNEPDEAVQRALYDHGPLTVVMKFDAFQNYRKGVIFYKEECTVQGTHAVTLIGWGTDKKTNKNYWLIKNSFGMDWGEGGLLKVERKENICLLKKWVTYPIIS